MRILVCGGRSYSKQDVVNKVLNGILLKYELDPEETVIIQGGAAGADTLARIWATNKKVSYVNVPAQWSKYGKYAGHKRNARMLSHWKPDLCVAFPGGRGTSDMIRRATDAMIPVIVVFGDGDSEPLGRTGHLHGPEDGNMD